MGAVSDEDMGDFIKYAVETMADETIKEFKSSPKHSITTRVILFADGKDKSLSSESYVQIEFGLTLSGLPDKEDGERVIKRVKDVIKTKNLKPFAVVFVTNGLYRSYQGHRFEDRATLIEKFNNMHKDPTSLRQMIFVFGLTKNSEKAMIVCDIDKDNKIEKFETKTTSDLEGEYSDALGLEPMAMFCDRVMKSVSPEQPASSDNLLDVPIGKLPKWRLN